MTLWYTARGAGLAALVMLTLATSLGALGSIQVSAATRVVMQYVHRVAAVFGLGLVAVHVTSLLADAKAGVGVAGALVPFASSYRPGAVAMGSIAAYTLVAVSALGAARGRLARSVRAVAVWRGVHTLAYGAWGLAMAHSLMAGTDASLSWVRTLWALCLVAVLSAVTARLAARRLRVHGVLR